MSTKNDMNKVIKKIQLEKNFTRTAVLQYLSNEYNLSYRTVFDVAKHNRMPKRKASADNILKLIKELK